MTLEDYEKEVEKLGLPAGWTKEPDPNQRARYFTAFSQLRKRILDDHLQALSQEERTALAEGKHPSQHHASLEQAKGYARLLENELGHINWVARVSVGHDQCDMLSLLVEMRHSPSREAMVKSLPVYFHGFQVKVINERKGEPTD